MSTEKTTPNVSTLMEAAEIADLGSATERDEGDVLAIDGILDEEDEDALIIDEAGMDFEDATAPESTAEPTAELPPATTTETPRPDESGNAAVPNGNAGNAADDNGAPAAADAAEPMEVATEATPTPSARVPPPPARNPMIAARDFRGTPEWDALQLEQQRKEKEREQRRPRSTIVVPPSRAQQARDREQARRKRESAPFDGSQWIAQEPKPPKTQAERDESDFWHLRTIGHRQSHPFDHIKRFGCARNRLSYGMLKKWHAELTASLINNIRAFPTSYPVRKIKDAYRRVNREVAPPDNGEFQSTASFMASAEVVELIRDVEAARAHEQNPSAFPPLRCQQAEHSGSYDSRATAGNNGRHPEWVPQEVVENLLPPRAGETRREPTEARSNRRWEEPQDADFRPTEQARNAPWADDAGAPAWGKKPDSPRQENKRAATTSHAQATTNPAKRASPPRAASAWNTALATRVQSNWNRQSTSTDSDTATVVPTTNKYALRKERKQQNKAAHQLKLRNSELDQAANAPAPRMKIRVKGHTFVAPELQARHLEEMRDVKYIVAGQPWHWYWTECAATKEHAAEHSRPCQKDLRGFVGITEYANEASEELKQRHALETLLHDAGVRSFLPAKLFQVEAEEFLRTIKDRQKLSDDLHAMIRSPTKETVDAGLDSISNNLKLRPRGFPYCQLLMLVQNHAYCVLS